MSMEEHMTIRTISSKAADGRPYVPAVAASGELVFVSGQIPLRDGELVSPSIETQARTVFASIESILSEAGASLGDVVRCGVFLADLADLPRFNAVYEQVFGGRFPTRTTVGANLPGYGVEVDCIAVVPVAED
jgi:2-iminobutanoate/2-iminopropanoate deaminase